MGDKTGIEWTDATINFWHGCTKVGPGCDHCYAEKQDARFGVSHWGSGVPRKKIKSAIPLLHRLDNQYAEWAADFEVSKNALAVGLPFPTFGPRRRVFVGSMSDFFDNEIDPQWREEAWRVMKSCKRVDIQVVTKRVSNVEKMIRGDWPAHIGLMVTMCNQTEADRDAPKLLALKAKFGIPWVGVSYEPALGPVDFTWALTRNKLDMGAGFLKRGQFSPGLETLRPLDWIICGGESGPGHRPMQMEWAEDVRKQCAAAGTAYFFKQDSGPRSGMRGRASDELWACRQFPQETSGSNAWNDARAEMLAEKIRAEKEAG